MSVGMMWIPAIVVSFKFPLHSKLYFHFKYLELL
uniref:Uncharacterized protein n=1 Tax=Arundo donax TaxID=35708 RepID=A0A0A9I165_ARUDO